MSVGTLLSFFDNNFIKSIYTGWDPSPRTSQSDNYDNLGYPFMATFSSTQAQFQEALLAVKMFIQSDPTTPRMGFFYSSCTVTL